MKKKLAGDLYFFWDVDDFVSNFAHPILFILKTDIFGIFLL